MLADPGLQHELQGQRAQALGGLREAAAEHAQQLEDVLVGDAGVARDVDQPRGLEVGLGVDGILGLRDRQAHRAAGGEEELEIDAAELGDLRGGVALAADDHAVGRQEHDGAGGASPGAVRQRHAVGGELLEQRQALARCSPSSPSSRPSAAKSITPAA